jgi:hypothetical protein
VRGSRSHVLTLTKPNARPRCEHRSHAEPSVSRSLHRLQASTGVTTGATPFTSESELPRWPCCSRRRSSNASNSRSVPYRLDTPPTLTVTRQLQRLVSESAIRRRRFIAENARPGRIRSDPSPRRRRHGVDPHRPYRAGGPSTSKRSKTTTGLAPSGCRAPATSTAGIREDPLGVRCPNTYSTGFTKHPCECSAPRACRHARGRSNPLPREHRRPDAASDPIRTSRSSPKPTAKPRRATPA